MFAKRPKFKRPIVLIYSSPIDSTYTCFTEVTHLLTPSDCRNRKKRIASRLTAVCLGLKLQPCSGNQGGGPTPRLDFIYTEKICGSMTFPDFQRQMEWCQSYFTKMSLKAHIQDVWVQCYPWLLDV